MSKVIYEPEYVTIRVPTGNKVCGACGSREGSEHEGYCSHAGKKANALWKKMMRAMPRRTR